MKQIKADISEDGTVKFDYSGFKDKTCLKEFDDVAKELEKLGIVSDVTEQAKKPEARMLATPEQEKQKHGYRGAGWPDQLW